MVTLREAATVMLVRDDPDLQVFMLRRNLESTWVGGRVRVPRRCRGPRGPVARGRSPGAPTGTTPGRARSSASTDGGLGLLGRRGARDVRGSRGAARPVRGAGAPGRPVDAAAGPAAGRARTRGRSTFLDARRGRGPACSTSARCTRSRTGSPPKATHRRYDTRFFVAAAPGRSRLPARRRPRRSRRRWVRPADALVRRRRGELELIFPTRKSLEALEPLRPRRRPARGGRRRRPTSPRRRQPRVVAGRRRDPARAARRPGLRRSAVGSGLMPDMTPEVPSALSPLVRRIVAANPSHMTGPGTNTYLVGIDEVAVIDPGPGRARSTSSAIVGASMRERVRWVLLTHTHPDHSPGDRGAGEGDGRRGARVHQAGPGPEGRPHDHRRRHDRRHRVPARGAAHPGPRAEPPLLLPRRGADPVHRRHDPRRHVLGGLAEDAAATWRSTSPRSSGCARCAWRRSRPATAT